jgi:hypothetical protein
MYAARDWFSYETFHACRERLRRDIHAYEFQHYANIRDNDAQEDENQNQNQNQNQAPQPRLSSRDFGMFLIAHLDDVRQRETIRCIMIHVCVLYTVIVLIVPPSV